MVWTQSRRSALAALVIVGIGAAAHAETAVAPPPHSPKQLVETMAAAYRNLDYDLYRALFASSKADGVEFRFVLVRPTPAGETEWGYDEEMRIHRRMFRPETIADDEKPLPRELWVRSITCELKPLTAFSERWDLYRSEQNPNGQLDRKQWRATEALVSTFVEWQLQGGGNFHVEGQARFIVIEDLRKTSGAPGKFLIYRWEDLGSGESNVAQK